MKNENGFTLIEMKDIKNVGSSVKKKNRQSGFTLIEMLIVLLVISILLLITIPNVTQHHASIQEKGCEGLINMVQAQATAYEIDHDEVPTIEVLKTAKYLRDTPVCPNGNSIVISANGEVTEVES